jgi:hypothetical protein
MNPLRQHKHAILLAALIVVALVATTGPVSLSSRASTSPGHSVPKRRVGKGTSRVNRE